MRFLREEPWPKGLLPRTALQLFYAQTLVTYTQAYGWEVRQRERVASSSPVDLKSWTYEQIFFEWLPAGEYTFKYRLRANMAGTFRVGPATVQSMYAPEFTAYSTGAVLTVGSARP